MYAVALAGALAAPAEAAFPGSNGRIVSATAASSSFPGIHTADDLGRLELTLLDGEGRNPAWSPDGSRVAFASAANAIQVIDQAGGNRTTVLEWGNGVGEIDWSPTGDKLVAELLTCYPDLDCGTDIYTMNLDGSELTNLTPERLEEHSPAWSPEGDRIVFSSTREGAADLYTIAPDGTGLTNLTSELPNQYFDPDWSPDASRLVAIEQNQTQHLVTMDVDGGGRVPLEVPLGIVRHPAWSPDGTRIAYEGGYDGGIATVRPDGTDLRSPGTAFRYGREPDWQPVRIPSRGSGYPRPKHAGTIRASLVPAYQECGSGDPPAFRHGPPLAFPSCADRLRSELLTVGKRSVGGVRMNVRRGRRGSPADEADVDIRVDITDVSCQLARHNCVEEAWGPWDYAGELQARIPVQITDKFNGAGPTDASATTMRAPLIFAIPCLATTDTEIGSTCSVTTSADSVLPGSVPEGKRSVWELGQIEIYDAGFQYYGGDRTLFMRQGLFVR